MTLYVDHDTIRKNGDRVEMWHLFDNKTAGTIDNVKKPFMSIKSQEEYNCKEGQSRQIATSFYSENMGKGEVVYSGSSPEPWAPAAPGSVGEALFKIACENK